MRARDISLALGVGDGLPAASAEAAPLPHADRRLVETLGGASALLEHVESFRSSIS